MLPRRHLTWMVLWAIALLPQSAFAAPRVLAAPQTDGAQPGGVTVEHAGLQVSIPESWTWTLREGAPLKVLELTMTHGTMQILDGGIQADPQGFLQEALVGYRAMQARREEAGENLVRSEIQSWLVGDHLRTAHVAEWLDPHAGFLIETYLPFAMGQRIVAILATPSPGPAQEGENGLRRPGEFLNELHAFLRTGVRDARAEFGQGITLSLDRVLVDLPLGLDIELRRSKGYTEAVLTRADSREAIWIRILDEAVSKSDPELQQRTLLRRLVEREYPANVETIHDTFELELTHLGTTHPGSLLHVQSAGRSEFVALVTIPWSGRTLIYAARYDVFHPESWRGLFERIASNPVPPNRSQGRLVQTVDGLRLTLPEGWIGWTEEHLGSSRLHAYAPGLSMDWTVEDLSPVDLALADPRHDSYRSATRALESLHPDGVGPLESGVALVGERVVSAQRFRNGSTTHTHHVWLVGPKRHTLALALDAPPAAGWAAFDSMKIEHLVDDVPAMRRVHFLGASWLVPPGFEITAYETASEVRTMLWMGAPSDVTCTLVTMHAEPDLASLRAGDLDQRIGAASTFGLLPGLEPKWTNLEPEEGFLFSRRRDAIRDDGSREATEYHVKRSGPLLHAFLLNGPADLFERARPVHLGLASQVQFDGEHAFLPTAGDPFEATVHGVGALRVDVPSTYAVESKTPTGLTLKDAARGIELRVERVDENTSSWVEPYASAAERIEAGEVQPLVLQFGPSLLPALAEEVDGRVQMTVHVPVLTYEDTDGIWTLRATGNDPDQIIEFVRRLVDGLKIESGS